MIEIDDLCTYLRILEDRGLTYATSGNYSIRSSRNTFLITRSGLQKGNVQRGDFLEIDILSRDVVLRVVDKNPSDETGLHCEIYRQDPEVGCVLHVHSIVGTALSMQEPLAKEFEFRGFEMQKAIANCRSHVEVVRIPILENSQDMDEIIEVMQQRVSELNQVKAFYLRGHGLYTWAYNLAQARKSLEAIEFLLNVKANMIQLGNSLVQPTN